MASAFDHDDVGMAVPVQSMARPPPSFNVHNFKLFGQGCPDQEMVHAIATRSIETKDTASLAKTMFATNHQSSQNAWRFITKANNTEKGAQHLFGYPISVSPPIFPAMYSPTGAVHKKDRLGNIDMENMRPTSDFSWGPNGHWLTWIVRSVNDSIDLEGGFPWVKYIGFKDFAEQALYLQALGEPVV